MNSHKDLKKYRTCILHEYVVAERKNLEYTRVVALPTPLASASPLSMLPYLLLQLTFPFTFPLVALRILRGLRTPCLTQSTICINNAIQHTELLSPYSGRARSGPWSKTGLGDGYDKLAYRTLCG
jgi:hypothetical protein